MKLNTKKIVSYIIALLPWLSNYQFIVSGFTVGDLLLIIALLVVVISKTKFKLSTIRQPQFLLIIYIFYASIIIFLNVYLNNIYHYDLVLKRSIKMFFYFTSIFILIPQYTNFDYFFKAYKRLVYLTCFALIVQYIGYFLAGTYFEFKLPFLSYNGEIGEGFDYVTSRLTNFRPDSIFIEPAYVVFFLIGYIILCLFWDRFSNPRVLEAGVVSLFILMTISSTGIFFLVTVWTLFFLKLILNKNMSFFRKIGFILLMLITVSLIIIVYFNTNLSNSLFRLGGVFGSQEASTAWNKIILGSEFLVNTDFHIKLFGAGLGNYPYPVFTTSVYFILYCTGWIGFILFSIWILSTFISTNNVGKVMTIMTIFLFSTWYLIYTPVFIFYNMIIINDTDYE